MAQIQFAGPLGLQPVYHMTLEPEAGIVLPALAFDSQQADGGVGSACNARPA